MTKQETWKLIAVMRSAYPKTYEKFTEEDFEHLCSVMFMCLEEFSYQQAALGLKMFLMNDTKGFPPVAGQIIEQIRKITPKPIELDGLQAWNLVMKGIRNGTYGAKKEFNNLPELVQKTIGSPQYLRDEASNSGFNLDVAKGQFLKNYENTLKREAELSKIPLSVRIEADKLLRIGENEV